MENQQSTEATSQQVECGDELSKNRKKQITIMRCMQVIIHYTHCLCFFPVRQLVCTKSMVSTVTCNQRKSQQNIIKKLVEHLARSSLRIVIRFK